MRNLKFNYYIYVLQVLQFNEMKNWSETRAADHKSAHHLGISYYVNFLGHLDSDVRMTSAMPPARDVASRLEDG